MRDLVWLKGGIYITLLVNQPAAVVLPCHNGCSNARNTSMVDGSEYVLNIVVEVYSPHDKKFSEPTR